MHSQNLINAHNNMDRPSVLRQRKPLPTPNSQQKSILDSHPDFQIVCRIASKIPKSRIVDSFSCRHLSLAKYRKKSAGDCIKVKSRYVDLSSISSSKCSDMDHTVYLQTPWLPLDFVRIHQMVLPWIVVTTSSCSLLLIY